MKRGKQIDTWYPFYIDKWLFGSTRHELILKDGDQFVDLRGIWMDLLTISKKDSGWIRANETTPYPTEQLAGMFCVPIEQLRKTIEIALDKGKVTEPAPGFYYISSTETYKLSDRWKREKEAMFPKKGRLCRKRGSIEDIKGEDIRGDYSKGEDTKKETAGTNIEKIKSLWNEFAAKYNLATISKIDPKSERGRHLAARMAEKDWDFPKLLEAVSLSPFLLGKKGKEPFFVTFDWLLWPGNYQRTMEGNYKDRKSNSWDEFMRKTGDDK
jgi:hypothetical protein